MSFYSTGRSQFGGQLPPVQTATKWLCGVLLGCTLAAWISGRRFGVGVDMLAYQAHGVLSGELWRLITYPFVENTTMGLLLSLLVLWMLGNVFERQWGARYFVQFFLWSAVGAGLFAIPIGYVVNLIMPFTDVGLAVGPDPCIDALLVSMAVAMPNANVLFGFVLPMRARTLIYVVLAIEVISGIQTGTSAVSMTLSGMLMGYLLGTGNWRPKRWWEHLSSWWRRRRNHGRLHVVPPRVEPKRPTWH